MRLILAIVWLGIAAFIGGIAGQLSVDLIMGADMQPPSVISTKLIAPGLVGTLVAALMLMWLVKTHYHGWLEALKYLVVYGILALAGGAAGFGIWGEHRLADIAGDNPVNMGVRHAEAQRVFKQFSPQLSGEVVQSDQALGLGILKASLSMNPQKNMLVFSPGLAQLLHMDFLLGDTGTQQEITHAAQLAAPSSLFEGSDRAVRELITHTESGVDCKWNSSIELSPASLVVPSARLRELSKAYCGTDIGTNKELGARESLFTTTIDFDGKWQNEFNPQLTAQGDFFEQPDHSVRASFMHQVFDGSSKVYYYQDPSAAVVGLPYKGNQLTAYIIEPKAGTSLADFVRDSSPQKLSVLIHSGNEDTGKLALPKLSIESSDKLNPILARIGITHLFDQNTNALPRLADNGASAAVWIKQKVKVSLDEKGTKVLFSISQLNATNAYHAEPIPFDLTVDRPFLLLVEDEHTKEWVFLGAIFSPNE